MELSRLPKMPYMHRDPQPVSIFTRESGAKNNDDPLVA